MMITHQHEEVGMATRLDILKQQLEELKERKELWRRQCQEEEKRMKLDFERQLAQIEEKFSDAMEKIELEFSAKKEALICKHIGKGVREESTITRSDSRDDKSRLQFACSNDSNSITTKSHPDIAPPRTQVIQRQSTVCDDNKGIPHMVPIVSTTTTNHSNRNQSARSARVAPDPIEMKVKQSTVNVAQECTLVKKAPVVVVSVERNAVSRCAVFDPGGALYKITAPIALHSGTGRCYWGHLMWDIVIKMYKDLKDHKNIVSHQSHGGENVATEFW